MAARVEARSGGRLAPTRIRRVVMRAPLLQAAFAAGLCLAAGCADAKQPANVVLIVVDTLRADLGKGIEDVATPAFDALARDGVAFSQAFSHAPMTRPSHAALFSGRSPHLTGIVANEWDDVPEDLPLLAEHLREQGFATAAVVSLWTLGTDSRSSTFERGFERYDRDYFGRIVQAPATFERMERVLDDLQGRGPFFLFAHFSDPHVPYNAHERPAGRMAELLLDGERVAEFDVSNLVEYEQSFDLAPGEHRFVLQSEHTFSFDSHDEAHPDGVDVQALPEEFLRGSEKNWRRIASKVTNRRDAPIAFPVHFQLAEQPSNEEKRARYPGEVAFVDRWVGALVDSLSRRGLYDDALVVFTSDHGEALGEHGWWGHKENLYDELLHVPLVVKPPAGHAAQRGLAATRDRLVRHADVVPTMLEILGLPKLPGQEGKSLLVDEARELVAVTRLLRAVEGGRFVTREDLVSLRDAEFKLVYRALADCFEMYDLRKDPGELVDVFLERRVERSGWEARLREMARTLPDTADDAVSPEDLEDLQGLGYGGVESAEAAPCSEG